MTGLKGTMGLAREHARGFLDAGADVPAVPVVQEVLLVVAELVSNAVRHAPGPYVLELSQTGARLLIAVSDGSSGGPVPRPPDLSAGGGGFGWHLVHRLSERVEVRVHGASGKTVTATVALLAG
ncbi:ATP-binding protein [Streptomyces sp. H39-S7]|uniref:ATP-binding protein n=1 Tax=Streptomyces sp. H39-S7 TaxID=3004357 RepID=UPI0022AF77F1|nr:ATP-binding protein [Streptomyces sp. H39-S7]MCZ4119796.1 ATP-binding protein [Streptomyces sp. H39-S7]